VNYDLRQWLLGEFLNPPADRAKLARTLVNEKENGRIKLYLTYRTLTYRRDHANLFREGAYLPLEATEYANEHIVAFARARGGEEALIVAPRLLVRRLGDTNRLPLGVDAWGESMLILPNSSVGQRYQNIFTDEIVKVIERQGVKGLPLAKVLANFPTALLTRLDEEPETTEDVEI
jgi:(1->4)-alpha-D-glucan 1-alpha-D-glucosylmutase